MDIKQEIPFAIPTDKIIISAGARAQFYNYLKNQGSCLVVCDENTKDFVKTEHKTIILPKNVKASLEVARSIPQGFDLYIAVGSGTINDIVKYASYTAGKPYIVVATAASMNGYASTSSSLLDGDYKKSFLVRPPAAIFMDLDVIGNAPANLTAAGIGDSFCRQLTENDNILANLARGDEYNPLFYRLMQTHEAQMFSDIGALCKTLIFGGVAMFAAGSSVPASGAEHMIAHYMELMQKDAPKSFHGQQIAVCTVAMAQIQERIIASGNFKFKAPNEAEISKHFSGTGTSEYFITETNKKFSANLNTNIDATKFNPVNAAEIAAKLKSAGLPTTPQDIGWDANIFADAIKFAAFTRNRITFLDLV